ncbi:hypothetical protein O6H91_08G119700 [Diphasiastrum complanatum]|uniref:Uncharacterized protein n=2 Tax=Diphasiastrum complanatum TaxID=34168 RepID=A0ACC2D1Y2_DIPCM|nr:hypothetical protein O6H91_08G119700 [Diphasiastrum complanatum]KAJ7548136.1 hypothetical protein O6H91_08G119700 [Diphasiastrum complanatum]
MKCSGLVEKRRGDMEQNQKPSLGEITDLVCEFLEVAIHLVLSVRGLYPAEFFERRRHFNVPVQWARHPELREYVHSAVTNLHSWIQQGIVEKVAIVILDNARAPQERFIFKLQVDKLYSKDFPISELEYALRAFYLKIPVSEPLLRPLPPDCTWEIVAYSKQLPGDGSSKGHFWVPADNGPWENPPHITPIKSMKSEPLVMQLYVEHPSVAEISVFRDV